MLEILKRAYHSRVSLSLQTFPRSVLVDEDQKQWIQWPIEEVKELRGEKVAIENKEIESGNVLEIGGITDNTISFFISSCNTKSRSVFQIWRALS